MNKRIPFYDNAKGILIILVVAGHVISGGPINQFVYSFHMPAFFIISGILQNYSNSNSEPLFKALLWKVYGLIVPFLFFEVLGVISNIIRFGITLNIWGYLTNTLLFHCNNGPDWFLWALFVDEAVFIIIHRIAKRPVFVILLSSLLAIIMIVIRKYFLLGSTGVGLLFFTFGYYAKPLFERQRDAALGIAAAIITVEACKWNGKVDLGPWEFGFLPVYIINSLAGTVMVIELSKFISLRLLKYFGKNTLTVLGTHQAINLALLAKLGLSDWPYPGVFAVLVCLLALELPIIWLFNKCIPILIGKRKALLSFKERLCILFARKACK